MGSCHLHNLQNLYRYQSRTNHENIKQRGPDIEHFATLDSILL